MSVQGLNNNVGAINQSDLIRQQELEEPGRRANFAGLAVKQVAPPAESPIQTGSLGPGASASVISNIDPAADSRKDFATQLQSDPVRAIDTLNQLVATAKGNDNPAAAGGPASIEGARKGEGTGRAGLAEGAAPARRLEATNDPVRAKDNGETGAARNAASPTDTVAQILAKVVELQKQLLNQVSEKPRGVDPTA